MRVAITGATGNVGTSLVSRLVEDPAVDAVVGIARRRPRWQPARTEWVTADVRTSDLRQAFRGCDAVVHLAWLFQPMRRPLATWRANVGGSARVFEAAAEAGVAALVYASSVGAYSPGPKDRAVDESWPTNGLPTAAYAREKAYVERLLDVFEGAHPQLRVVRMRPAFIFKREAAVEQRRLFGGPLLPHRLVAPGVVPVVPSFPGLRFQALHAADAAEAYRLALHRPVRGAFNLAAEPVLDADALAELLRARVVPLPLAGVRAAMWLAFQLRLSPVVPELLDVLAAIPVMGVERARTELGWRPERSAPEALSELFAGLHEGGGQHTPPLDPTTSGRGRWREFAAGVGGRAL